MVFAPDALTFAEPEHFNREHQIPALEKLLVCGSDFAERAFAAGLRWNPLRGEDSIEDHIDWLRRVEHDGSRAWLLDTATGRDVWPMPEDLARAMNAEPQEKSAGPGVRLISSSTDQWGRIRERDAIRDAIGVSARSERPCLDGQVPVWEVNEVAQFKELANQARTICQNHSANLWLRGQTNEYYITRDPDVTRIIGLAATETSLIPSLARDPITDVAIAWDMDVSYRAAVLWWIAQDPVYSDRIKSPKLREWLAQPPTNVSSQMGVVVHELVMRAHEDDGADLLDDARQILLSDFNQRQRFMPLWLQHYGARTSVLDVTDDDETALYFARRKWDRANRRFVDGPSDHSPVIYMFADIQVDPCFSRWTDAYRIVDYLPPVSLTPRILSQRCGLIRGSMYLARNFATELLIGVVTLGSFKWGQVRADLSVFPAPDADRFFERLLMSANPAPPNLQRFGW